MDREFKKAVRLFTKALEHFDANRDNQHDLAVIHCARSHAFFHMKKSDESLADAERAIELRPTWSKARRSQQVYSAF